MKYIYYVDGEQREPTPEEWSQLADAAFEAAGYQRTVPKDKDSDSVN